jgi:ABC-type multidrug transport system fused ATPase/permease subunit
MRSFPDADPATPDIRTPLRYLLWLVADHRRAMVLGTAFAVVWTVAQGLSPAVVGEAVDAGIIARDRTALVWWGAAVLALGLVQALGGALQDRCALSAKVGSAYQTVQFVTLQACRLGATLPRRVSTGDVVSVSVSDVNQIGAAMELATRGVGAVVAIAVVAALMLSASWQLGLVVLAGVPVMLLLTTLLIRPLHRRQNRLRGQQRALTDQAVDIVQGLRVLRGIGGEDVFARRYTGASQRVRGAAVRVAQVDSVLDAAKSLLPGLLVVLIVMFGARQVLAGGLSAGQLVAFYGYAVFLAVPMRRLIHVIGQLMKAHVAAGHVTRLLRLVPEIVPGAPGAAPAGPGALTDPASGLVVHPGLLTTVACATPGDAAALADRLGYYVRSDAAYAGRPLRELPLDEVRRRVLVVRNDARLFAGPLRVELDPTDGAGDRTGALQAALDSASARDIVDALPEGLDTPVTSGGREFSGGQQQRLRLARALLADPEVLILLDPTSAVDAHTEARVGDRLRHSRAGRTTVVFTTSPILLHQADRVCFVADGRVVAEGTHGSLLSDDGYRSLVARGVAA